MQTTVTDAASLGHWTCVLDAIPVGLSIHSNDGLVMKVNKGLGQIYGRTPESFVGQSCAALFHQQPDECPHEQVLQSMSQAELTTEMGSRKYQVIINVVIDSSGAVCGFTRMMIDLTGSGTGRVLPKADHAGTLEQLISGIAHDVGTPLGIISGYAEYLLMRSKAGEPGHKELSTILQQTRRIADSIKQMLDMVRPSTGRVDAIGLKGFLTELVDLMGHHLRKASVKASVSCDSNPPLVYGDAPKLRRAFFDLMINSIEQVGQDGDIELILNQVPGRDDLVRIVLAGRTIAGPAPHFEESFASLGSGADRDRTGPALSLTREILEAFKAEIGMVDLGERGLGLSIDLPVRAQGGPAVAVPRTGVAAP
jgi:light-regulated signal transduction histidine kinase (bacteriophytochrome)